MNVVGRLVSYLFCFGFAFLSFFCLLLFMSLSLSVFCILFFRFVCVCACVYLCLLMLTVVFLVRGVAGLRELSELPSSLGCFLHVLTEKLARRAPTLDANCGCGGRPLPPRVYFGP